MDLEKTIDVLRKLSPALWLGLALTGALILYLPPVSGLDLSAARRWPWTAPATLASACIGMVLCLVRLGDFAFKLFLAWVAARPSRSLSIVAESAINTSWWGAAEQADGSTTTQIKAEFDVYNRTDQPVRIVRTRLIRPRVHDAQHLQGLTTLADVRDPYRTSMTLFVAPLATMHGHLHVLIRKRLGRSGSFLPVTVGLTDQHGHEHRVYIRLWPMPEPSTPVEATRL